MTAFRVVRHIPASVSDVWARVADLRAHGDHVPLTRMVTDAGAPRVGWAFSGITALGPFRLVDAMVVTRWEPPTAARATGVLRIEKVGRLLAGWAEIEVSPHGDAGSRVVWSEELGPRQRDLARLLRVPSAAVGRRLFERVVDSLLAGVVSDR
ncbi:SRPBCC family protein [Janibacter sp. G1551]|uniref:SRPBCC family protein n=1 Tax=Janibacter sp. G1551 TaxID=3420440 RepID=UPI003D032B35